MVNQTIYPYVYVVNPLSCIVSQSALFYCVTLSQCQTILIVKRRALAQQSIIH